MSGSGATKALAGGIEQPLDLIRLSLDERVLIKLKGDREIKGVLHAFDQHMNLVLGQAEETSRTDASTGGKPVVRNFEMLFVRGDSIILAAPPARFSSS